MNYLMMSVLALACASSAHAGERFKALPTARDNAEMEQQVKPGQQVKLEAFLAAPEKQHWVAFYEAADQLFAQGKKNDALKWFYAGQIRGRVAAGLDPDSSRNNAMLVAMNSGIGAPIMDYAKSDATNWVAQIDAALAWDLAHPLPADPFVVIGVSEVMFDTSNFHSVYAQVREGLGQMRAGLAKDLAPPSSAFLPREGRIRR
ncbi:MAG: hypothetical protein DI582_02105 [Azospirillum brasilense]|nr:MAG: hypothetical protein DI582_02105 [Azospirillum brasilense]